MMRTNRHEFGGVPVSVCDVGLFEDTEPPSRSHPSDKRPESGVQTHVQCAPVIMFSAFYSQFAMEGKITKNYLNFKMYSQFLSRYHMNIIMV
jgi:hypothetical protein